MEVTALCIRLLMKALMLTLALIHLTCSQKADVVSLHVVPNRQQHFEYESIVFSCEGLNGLTGWRVMKKIKAVNTICASSLETSKGPCTIKPALSIDSGEYWCEAGGKNRSNTVYISVTAGDVILEIPLHPVIEGEAVTLCCRVRTTSYITADFYKDGFLIKSNTTGNMTIRSVSKSDEGHYKCNVSKAGESADSWLTVRSFEKVTHPSDECCSYGHTMLRIVGTILLVVLVLVVMGLFHFREQCRRYLDMFLSIVPCTDRSAD